MVEFAAWRHLGFIGRLWCLEVATNKLAALTRFTLQLPVRRMFLALSSAALLIFSFPNFNQPWCAWIALVPWLLLLPNLKPRKAFWWSWFIGFLFFLGSIHWLTHVTVFGWALLCAYLAFFFGIFGWLASLAQPMLDPRPKTQGLKSSLKSYVLSLIVAPSAWVALEHARTHLLSGFGWNLLAYSQTPWPMIIQIARLTGAWGVSFMIVMANAAIFQAIQRRSWRKLFAPAGVVVAALLYAAGTIPLKAPVLSRIAVVQGNIPQEHKWDEAYKEEILSRYECLTRLAAESQLDLIVWPETSAPGYVGVDEDLTQRIFRLAKQAGRPLLIGSPVPKLAAGGFVFLNRASLINQEGEIVNTYDKLHLVPYGEFIPGDKWFPWLRKLLPPIGDFVPGKEYTVFSLKNSRLEALGSRQAENSLQPTAYSRELRFSVLICFEDVFPELARAFVRRGAQALVVITNDAWFGPTAAAHQHAQASLFRSVELGVPVIRAANTGWSGCIDPEWGAYRPVKDVKGQELFVTGTATCGVYPGSGNTFYVRWGDWFAWGCVLAALIGILPGIMNNSYSRKNGRRA